MHEKIKLIILEKKLDIKKGNQELKAHCQVWDNF